MGGGGDGGSKIGGGVELTDAVLTCEGHISDPQLSSKLSHLASCLQTITDSDKWLVRKVERWNSVKVTFSIPKEAAERLHLLAQAGDSALRQLGILSVQVDGDQIVSLKVNGPNNEPSEILLRADHPSSSSEMLAPSAIPRQASHSFVVPSLVGGQTSGHKIQPIPQFRSPVQGTDGSVGPRKVVSHSRTAQQGFSFVEAAIGPQRATPQQPPPQQPPQGIPSIPGIPFQRVLATTTRPTFPINPPPPYPGGQDAIREGNNVHTTVQTSMHKAGPSQVVATQLITAHTSSTVSSYRASPGHSAQPNNAIIQSGRNVVRAPVNMVKNSPLLVGLLQSPEHNPPIVKNTKISSLPTPHNISRVSEGGPASPALTNVAVMPSVSNTGLPVINRSRESTPTVQQVYPGAVAATNSLPNTAHPICVSKPPQVLGNSQMQLSAPKTQHSTETRVPTTDGIRYLPVVSSGQPELVGRGLINTIKQEAPSTVTSSSHKKIDSQYLINPNTGLLEPRPNTDSSDSETEGKSPSHASNSVPSDDESSSNSGSRKEPSVSRSKILPSHKEKLQERETASWHNSLINSEEKIKLKLKLGREPCAQTTIIANKRRDPVSCTSSAQVTSEPRVPKLHIKLNNSCQPVIVKSIEDPNISGSLDVKNAKFRKKLGRNKLREDELKFKSAKHKGGDDISARFVRLSDAKRLREGDHDSEGAAPHKAPKLCDDSKITISKASRTDKSRKPRKPVRKIGDLNSLGEIASHKIMETLPPAITKVADMHAQQQQAMAPSISSLFSPQSVARDPLSCDMLLEPKEKEVPSALSSSGEASREHPLAVASSKVGSTFLSNGDVCVGATISKTILNSSETSTYRDSPDGLGSVKKFLNSSVLINKLGAGKPSYSNCINNYRVVEEPDVRTEPRSKQEPIFKKLEGYKNCDFPLIRTTSDITIQSVSKSDLLNMGKMEVSKPKIESSKVGRVLCVDVMDRKALEEALKSSRDSVKKAETSPKDPATSMVDRLRRWNSIDNSSPVPFNSHQTTSSDSTNLPSAAVKGEPNNCLADGESGKNVCENNSTETNCHRQAVNIASVNSKNDCDNSCAVNSLPVGGFSQCSSEGCGDPSSSSTADRDNADKKEYLVEANISDAPSKPDVVPADHIGTTGGGQTSCNISISKGDSKVTELAATKVDVDSPEGTPKGDHGNGQGGEDSGIESMDALSEKSPNHNDQSPHRREDKECDIYSMKCKDSCDSTQLKEQQACSVKENSQSAETIEGDQTSEVNCPSVRKQIPDAIAQPTDPKPDISVCAATTSTPSLDKITEPLVTSTDSTTQSAVASQNAPAIKTDSCTNVAPINSSKATDAKRFSPVKIPNALVSTAEPLMPPSTTSFPNEVRRPLVGSTPISLTTTTIANSSIILQKFLTSSPGTGSATTSTKAENISGGTNNNKSICGSGSNAKPSLLAITLTRPPGGAKINSQYAASIARSLDKQSEDALKAPPLPKGSLPSSTAEGNGGAVSCSVNISNTTTFTIPATASTAIANISKPLVATITPIAISSVLPETPSTAIVSNSSVPANSSTSIAATSNMPASSTTPIAVTSSVLASSTTQIAATTGVIASSGPPMAAVTGVVANSSMPIASTNCSTAIAATGDVPATFSNPITAMSGVPSNSISPIAATIDVSQNFSNPIAATSGASVNSSNPITTISGVPSSSSSPIATTSGVSANSITSIATTSGVSANSITSIATTSGVSANSITSIATTSGVSANSITSIATTSGVSANSITSTATTSGVSANSITSTATTSIHTPLTSSTPSVTSISVATTSVPLVTTCTVPATTSAPTMILLATTTTSASTSNSKIVSVKTSTTSTITPIAKAFRLVALPTINAVTTPASNPVRGQIVTLKPVIAMAGSSQAVISPSKLDVQPVPPTPTKLETILNHVSSSIEVESEDLDFVGFSSAKKAEELKEKQMCESTNETSPNLLSPAQEEPTPMRVQPPLYTYGNKERKKSECDVEDKEHDFKSLDEDEQVVEEEMPINKLKEVILDALTIEIPAVESMADDKRLIRTTRQSARLSSPKVNSTSGDLSPHPDKKLVSVVSTAKQQPVRASVSPALRGGVKRKRHESESSNASSVSEDLQDGSTKSRRRKTTARDELLKGRATRFKEAAEEKDKVETSDEEGHCDQVSTLISTSTEDGLSSSKSGPAKDKEVINLRENVRRASRQKSQPEKEELGDGGAEGKSVPKSSVKVATAVKIKKENMEQSDSEAGRRKTRSTAGNASEDVPNKRRRQSKEK